MKTSIKSNHNIQSLQRNQVRLAIANKKLLGDLMKLGIHERKSLDLEPMLKYVTDELKHHFIRGYFDGDGSIFWTKTGSKDKRRYISFRGTKAFLEEVKAYFGVGGTIQFNTGTHQLRVGAKADVEHIYQVMYRDASVRLERKYLKFVE